MVSIHLYFALLVICLQCFTNGFFLEDVCTVIRKGELQCKFRGEGVYQARVKSLLTRITFDRLQNSVLILDDHVTYVEYEDSSYDTLKVCQHFVGGTLDVRVKYENGSSELFSCVSHIFIIYK